MVLQGLHGGETVVAVFWVVPPCSLAVGNRRFRGSAASIFRVEVCDHEDVTTALLPVQRDSCNAYISSTNINPEDGGSTVSKTLVPNHQITQANKP